MILVLLDTNAYLRLAKRIRPALGISFGAKGYQLTIHKRVEDEVLRSPRLKYNYPWFNDPEFAGERLAQQLRLTKAESAQVGAAQSVLAGWVQSQPENYTCQGRSPPGEADCWMLALCQVKDAIVVTDDLGMHALAGEFNIPVWHGYELLSKLRAAKIIDSPKVREIYQALAANQNLPASWQAAKNTMFRKVFGAG